MPVQWPGRPSGKSGWDIFGRKRPYELSPGAKRIAQKAPSERAPRKMMGGHPATECRGSSQGGGLPGHLDRASGRVFVEVPEETRRGHL